ncbi:MAG: tagaturonate epimerase family protein, partial [Caldanaerobacter sp.]
MINKVAEYLSGEGFYFYEKSFRKLSEDIYIFVVKKANEKSIGLLTQGDFTLSSPYFTERKYLKEIGYYLNLYPLTYENFVILKDKFSIAPSPCNKKVSFGMGDRLGLVTAAHIRAIENYDVFPVLAQQSPRELMKTHRSFKEAILKAILGVLEEGYTGKFGADGDHIKDENYLMEAIDAGYTMYTLDLSDMLVKLSDYTESQLKEEAKKLNTTSKRIIEKFRDKSFVMPTGEAFTVSEEELYKSALTYEKA